MDCIINPGNALSYYEDSGGRKIPKEFRAGDRVILPEGLAEQLEKAGVVSFVPASRTKNSINRTEKE